jgi:hypothetical protein
MEYCFTCTTEELALMVALEGYPGVAKGIAEASIGKKSPKEWKSIMEVTVHQLVLKKIWDEEKDQQGEVPLSDELHDLITSYVKSNWMIRCSNLGQSNILMFHHVEGEEWLSHVIDRDIIHEFAYVTRDAIPNIVRDYYAFSQAEVIEPAQFKLSDHAFDLLSQKQNDKKTRKMSSFSQEEEESFNRFIHDLEMSNWSLYNISLFQIPGGLESEPIIQNIVFFLPSIRGIWIVEYTDHPVSPVQIQLCTFEEWYKLLKGVGLVAGQVLK